MNDENHLGMKEYTYRLFKKQDKNLITSSNNIRSDNSKGFLLDNKDEEDQSNDLLFSFNNNKNYSSLYVQKNDENEMINLNDTILNLVEINKIYKGSIEEYHNTLKKRIKLADKSKEILNCFFKSTNFFNAFSDSLEVYFNNLQKILSKLEMNCRDFTLLKAENLNLNSQLNDVKQTVTDLKKQILNSDASIDISINKIKQENEFLQNKILNKKFNNMSISCFNIRIEKTEKKIDKTKEDFYNHINKINVISKNTDHNLRLNLDNKSFKENEKDNFTNLSPTRIIDGNNHLFSNMSENEISRLVKENISLKEELNKIIISEKKLHSSLKKKDEIIHKLDKALLFYEQQLNNNVNYNLSKIDS